VDARNQKREPSPCFSLFSQGSCTPGDLYRTITRTLHLSINFLVNFSAIPYCSPRESVPKTQMSAVRRDLDWSAASARLLFDGEDAVFPNTVRTPSRRGHRPLPVATARFLCGRTLKDWYEDFPLKSSCDNRTDHDQQHCFHHVPTVNQKLLLQLIGS
jgi:hypothetical protein